MDNKLGVVSFVRNNQNCMVMLASNRSEDLLGESAELKARSFAKQNGFSRLIDATDVMASIGNGKCCRSYYFI
ncbi:hypothetical protein JOC86_004539 [Bacillus pakistanensis]|uniref:Uncharacterized protein n=1 Tax=Rossellomorea pakistanensis TaxID=992288 RepID=A0ABS2NJC7_9BACI|nr:hypothetical protein [Bacillus pakistanensis]MBM7587964.1 hypothetical protein [Bacillus pakistanensis]